MSKNLLISALLILFLFSTKLQSGDNDIITSLPGGDDNETVIAADSTDALTVFSAKIKDKTVYINW